MYVTITGTSIEFYYNTKTIKEIAEMYSAYKAARLESGTDVVNYTSDEADFGQEEVTSTLNEIFTHFRKIMVDEMVYFNDAGTGHGADPYSGMFIHENSQWDLGLLIMLDQMITEAAAYGLLYNWYVLTPSAELSDWYRQKYLNKLSKIHNLAFNLRKPIGSAIVIPTSNIPAFCSKTVDIPARAEFEVTHCINSDDYIVQSFDANGKQVYVTLVKREAGILTIYSNVAILAVTFSFTGTS